MAVQDKKLNEMSAQKQSLLKIIDSKTTTPDQRENLKIELRRLDDRIRYRRNQLIENKEQPEVIMATKTVKELKPKKTKEVSTTKSDKKVLIDKAVDFINNLTTDEKMRKHIAMKAYYVYLEVKKQ